MTEEARKRDKLIGLFVFGVVALNPPILSLFSGGVLFGWPLLYLYLFFVWAVLIGVTALVVERRRADLGEPDN